SIASEIDDQSLAIQAPDCLVDIARNIDTDRSRKHADIQPTDLAMLHRRDWLQLNQRPLFRLRLWHFDPQSHVSAVPPLNFNRRRFPQRKQRKVRGGNLVLSTRKRKSPGCTPALKAAPPG